MASLQFALHLTNLPEVFVSRPVLAAPMVIRTSDWLMGNGMRMFYFDIDGLHQFRHTLGSIRIAAPFTPCASPESAMSEMNS
jgi:hypothetical protein